LTRIPIVAPLERINDGVAFIIGRMKNHARSACSHRKRIGTPCIVIGKLQRCVDLFALEEQILCKAQFEMEGGRLVIPDLAPFGKWRSLGVKQ